jgi:hypothetical protein
MVIYIGLALKKVGSEAHLFNQHKQIMKNGLFFYTN